MIQSWLVLMHGTFFAFIGQPTLSAIILLFVLAHPLDLNTINKYNTKGIFCRFETFYFALQPGFQPNTYSTKQLDSTNTK